MRSWSSAAEKVAVVFAFVGLIVATAWLLDQVARHQFAVHLRNQAARALALAATSATPYQWYFKNPDDLVAGRPFDTQSYDFVDGGLQLRSAGAPFEIGLRLTRPVDLRSFPQLRFEFDAGVGGEFVIVAREKLGAPQCVSSAITFTGSRNANAVDLASLTWHDQKDPDVAKPAPPTAALLRLRFLPAAAGSLLLRTAALQRPDTYRPLDLGPTPVIVEAGSAPMSGQLAIYRLPFSEQSQKVDIAAIVANRDLSAVPLIALPERGRVEQRIALRNAVYAALPSAILIPEADYERTVAKARKLAANPVAPTSTSTQWRLVALFAAMLVFARLRPPRQPRLRALIEIVLTLTPIAWLILGGNVDGRMHAWQAALIGITLAYAASLSLPRTWRWNAGARAWVLALLVVAMAVSIGLVFYESGSHLASAPGWRQVLRYLGWALLQQYLMCAVCTERWSVITGNFYVSAYLGALGFALLHTPNAALMIATFVGGLCWCAIYLRYRALLPLGVSHAASALVLSTLLPVEILHSAEVSVRFFQ